MFDLGYVQNEGFGYRIVSVTERDVLGNPLRYSTLLSAEEVQELLQMFQQLQQLQTQEAQPQEQQDQEIIIDEL